MSPKSDLTKVIPSKDLTDAQCHATFQRLQRRLAAFRNTAELHATAEAAFINTQAALATKDAFVEALDAWAEETQKNLWLACREPGGGTSCSLAPPSTGRSY